MAGKKEINMSLETDLFGTRDLYTELFGQQQDLSTALFGEPEVSLEDMLFGSDAESIAPTQPLKNALFGQEAQQDFAPVQQHIRIHVQAEQPQTNLADELFGGLDSDAFDYGHTFDLKVLEAVRVETPGQMGELSRRHLQNGACVEIIVLSDGEPVGFYQSSDE